MKASHFVALATLVVGINCAVAQTSSGPSSSDSPSPPGPKTEKEEAPRDPTEPTTPVSQAKSVIESVYSGLKDKSLGKMSLSVLKELLDDARSAQSRVYVAVRTINRNLDASIETEPGTIAAARMRTKDLLKSSYSDSLFQSKNLSDQIKTRLGNLVADSLLLQQKHSKELETDFLAELGILTDRFTRSKTFRAGIGADYTKSALQIPANPHRCWLWGGERQ